MEGFVGLAAGFATVFQPTNLLFCFLGALLGTAIGVLPGLGPVATVSVLLPFSFYLDPITAIILLSGIYLGAMYGGSITSILVNVPGEAGSIVTCIDGHQMARNGRAGAAIALTAYGSFFGGVTSAVGLAITAPFIPRLAQRFGPPELSLLMVFGLLLAISIGRSGPIRGLIMIALGLLCSMVGTDPIAATPRFTFGATWLADGVNVITIAVGLIGVSELLLMVENRSYATEVPRSLRFRELLPNRAEWSASVPAMGRGAMTGFFLGLVPGCGVTLVSFVAYAFEKRVSRTPDLFGKGIVQGVVGPETANNAASQSCFGPMLTLGLPPNAMMGVMMGALLIHGIAPGPQLITSHPDLFWSIIAGMLVANLILLILNVPLVSIFVQLLRVREELLTPCILAVIVIGTFAGDGRVEDVVLMFVFGMLGYFFRKKNFDLTPFVLAFVLGPILETSIRQSLLLGNGSLSIFTETRLSITLLIILVGTIAMIAFRRNKTRPPANGQPLQPGG